MSEEIPLPGLHYEGRVLPDTEVVISAGPERVADEKPPKGWKAAKLMGFGTREDE